MLSSLRYIATISLLAVFIGAVAMGQYFNKIQSDDLLKATQHQNEAILGSYTSIIWQKYYPATPNPTPPDANTLADDSARFFQSFLPIKITVFSPDVKQLYYSSTKAVVMDENGRVPLFDLPRVTHGQSVSRILTEATFTNGDNTRRVLTQTIIPLFTPEMTPEARAACLLGTSGSACTPIAMAEVYNDISPRWHALQFQQLLFTGLIIGAFIILGLLLLLTTKRAQTIIARQHELNLELTAAAARAEAQSRDKSQFLASVSHELRTPLNAIIGFSEIVKTEAKDQLQKVYHDYVEDIYASGKHLLSLINDILDYSKAEAGKLQIEWAETDVTKIIRNSLRMVMPRAETAQIMLIEDIPSQHLIITTDAKKLKQILLNLLSNAVKFTPAGGEVRCQAWEDITAHAIVIQVRDTGIGIAPKDISRVMTPFGQVDSALSRKYEGTGLGLPLAKAFLESMGGNFTIESALNKGTSVTITLPKTPKNSSTPTQSTEESNVPPE